MYQKTLELLIIVKFNNSIYLNITTKTRLTELTVHHQNAMKSLSNPVKSHWICWIGNGVDQENLGVVGHVDAQPHRIGLGDIRNWTTPMSIIYIEIDR